MVDYHLRAVSAGRPNSEHDQRQRADRRASNVACKHMKRGPPHDDQTGNADPSVSAPSHGGLGDLISDRTLGFWGSAGSASGFSPIERVLLSANGNLQRLVSSYLNSHVSVTVKHSTKKSHGVYEREVALLAQGQEFGVATSTVTLSRDDCIDAVDRRGVAIGQMFRHLNIMPRFTLHRFGEALSLIHISEPTRPY